MPMFVLDIENLCILLHISFDPTAYGRVITITGHIRLLYRGATVVKIPIEASGGTLDEDHQNLHEDFMDSDY